MYRKFTVDILFEEEYLCSQWHGKKKAEEYQVKKFVEMGYTHQEASSQANKQKINSQLQDSAYIPLPILKYRRVFLDLLEDNRIILVDGRTGTGKSTQIPLYIADEMRTVMETELKKPEMQQDLLRLRKPRIILTQPKRLGAKTLAESLLKMQNDATRKKMDAFLKKSNDL